MSIKTTIAASMMITMAASIIFQNFVHKVSLSKDLQKHQPLTSFQYINYDIFLY